MKYKKRFLLLLSMLFLFVLSACSNKTKDADKIASLFADRVLYNTNVKDYEQLFSDSELFNKRTEEIEDALQDNFAMVFEPISGVLSLSEREDISSSLLNKVRKTAKYSYTVDENTKKMLKVTYHIKGFDYANLVGMMMSNLLAHEDKIDIGSGDAKHVVTTAYYDGLDESTNVSKAIDVPIYFKKDKNGKWMVDSSKTNTDNLQNLLFVFVTGKAHDDNYEKDMLSQINTIVAKEQQKK